MSKILLIGPRQNKFNKEDTGGVVILFELLLSELESRNIEFAVIDTLKANYKNNLQMLITVIWRIVRDIKKYDYITLQPSSINSFVTLAPIVIMVSKVFSKPISIRNFAGDFKDIYQQGNFLKKRLIEFCLKNVNVVFFETKYLVDFFEKYNPNTFWFPNVRSFSIKNSKFKKFKKRFLYIGSINDEKGIDDLCSVIKQLPSEFVCDLYGPIKYQNEKYSIKYFEEIGVSYRGALESNSVLETLDEYDVLILPSYREGYPGVIIEAFARGLPVIATRLEGIMEMCSDFKNSILIDVGNQRELLEAIKYFNEENYISFHEEALDSFKNFNSFRQTELFLEHINYKKGNYKSEKNH